MNHILTDSPWRRLPYSVDASERHIALSNALVRLARQPTLWWHSTDRPTLILGAGQRAESTNTDPVLAPHAVRRTTGGTAVYAAPGVLGLDVVLPITHRLAGTDVVEAYRWLGEIWAAALGNLGIDTHVVSIAEARAAASGTAEGVRMACFGTLSPYEVTVENRKLVGFAQVRRRAGVLLQSGIHRHFDAHGLASLLPVPDRSSLAAELARRAVGLDEVTGVPMTELTVMSAVERELARGQRIRLRDGTWTEDELTLAGANT